MFVSESDGGSTGFNTLTLPLPSILSTRFEQPYLGSNYVSIDIRPSSDGGLAPGTKSEIRLRNQGIFQFVSLLEKTRERALYMRRQMRDEEESLRTMAKHPCSLSIHSDLLVSRICIASAGPITRRGHTCRCSAEL
jgi:hypothetical protein